VITVPNQILGNYEEQSNGNCEYLTLAFSPLSAPIHARWRNNGLSADFLGDYVITFLPKEGDLAIAANRQHELSHAVSYVANELLENAMKYHAQGRDVPIRIHLELTDEYISVSASNGVDADQADRYKEFVKKLLEGEPGDLLIQRLEESARDGQPNQSGLGLLTIMNDYGAQLGWRFEVDTSPHDVAIVTTRAVLAPTMLGSCS
jgi:hypothetical protein